MTRVSHVGLGINPATNDLHFDATGNLVLVNDALAVGQHVRQRLKTFQGEWFLDITAGTPWLDQILGRHYDPALAEAIVKAEIMNTGGVIAITSFSVSFDRIPRRLNIRDIEVLTNYDEEVAV
jgi:hypothetical protein